MADLGKVIYSIERCICHVPDACRDCYYDAGHPYNECVELLLRDALELLKAQEPKNILDVADSVEGIEVGKCPRCDRTIVSKQSDPTWYCKYCGQAVKWE